jgi:mycoredoxin
VEFLKNNDIAFEYYYIESEPEDVVKKIVEVNGGEDWVIPTLEYNGSWVPGKFFDPIELKNDLEKMGIACP